jgi:hypothetical protein
MGNTYLGFEGEELNGILRPSVVVMALLGLDPGIDRATQ